VTGVKYVKEYWYIGYITVHTITGTYDILQYNRYIQTIKL
jgi:hypothetical protein